MAVNIVTFDTFTTRGGLEFLGFLSRSGEGWLKDDRGAEAWPEEGFEELAEERVNDSRRMDEG